MNQDKGPSNVGPPPDEVPVEPALQSAKRKRVPKYECEHSSIGCFVCRLKAKKQPFPYWEPAGDAERRYQEYRTTKVWPKRGEEVYTVGDILICRPLYRDDVESVYDQYWDEPIKEVLFLDFSR